MGDETGAWIGCPRCGARIGLSRFSESDDERAVAVAVCVSCGERVTVLSGEPGRDMP